VLFNILENLVILALVPLALRSLRLLVAGCRWRVRLNEAEKEAAAKAAALAASQGELRQASRLNEAETAAETAAAEMVSVEEGSDGGSADEETAASDQGSAAGSTDAGESNSASEAEDLVPHSAP